jgi:hypothetical protein
MQQGEGIDPLNFAGILINSRHELRFTRLDYEDLLNDAMIYEDRFGVTFGKDQVLDRLNTITKRYDSIVVAWELTDTSEKEKTQVSTEETALLQSRTYRARPPRLKELREDTATGLIDTVYEYDYMGEASFELQYDASINAWTVSHWREGYTEGYEKSFFHPEFSP